jgi:taurine dioxygenase
MRTKFIRDIGIEIEDLNIDELTQKERIDIKDLYYKHNIVVIRQASVNALSFAKLCSEIGKLCNEPFDPSSYDGPLDEVPVQRVSGIRNGDKAIGIFGKGKLDWHCNMNGPSRAPGVGLIAVSGVEESVTSWMSTVPAYRDMPLEIKNRIRNLVGHFQYNPDKWAPGMEEWQREGMMEVARRDGPYTMNLLQKSPSGEPGLYFHFLNDCQFPEDPEMYGVLMETLFQERYIYHHHWQVGDIVLSNQLITLHKRQTDNVSNRLLYRYTYQHAPT